MDSGPNPERHWAKHESFCENVKGIIPSSGDEPLQAADPPPLCCYLITTFLHVNNVLEHLQPMVCQTRRLHQYTPFNTRGWLTIHHIDFPNGLHLKTLYHFARGMVVKLK